MKVAILLAILGGDLPARPTCCLSKEVREVYAEIYCWEGSKKMQEAIASGELVPVEEIDDDEDEP